MGTFRAMLMLALLPILANAGTLGANIRSMKRNLRVARFAGENEDTNLVAPFKGVYNIDKKRCATGYWHVACTHNVQTKAIRDYKEETPKEDREEMTVEVCWNFCKNVSGAQYFALSRGSECSCLPFFHDDHDYAGKMCDQACDGDKSMTCGGDRLQDMYEMHDCNNMPAVYCKSPPAPVQYAKTFNSTFYRGIEVPCKNAKAGLTTHEQHCQVECIPGYWLKSNTITCTEKGDRLHYTWAQIEGSATCWPVSCGPPPALDYALYKKQNVSYPGSVTYTCKSGYTLDQSPTGESVQDVKCMTSAKYDTVETCKPVLCGKCPTSYPHGSFRETSDRVYQEQCTFDCAEGYTLNEDAEGPNTFSVSCLHNGAFQEGPTCLPVKCRSTPVVAFAKQTGAEPELKAGEEAVYQQVVNYTCEPGYSIGGTVNSTKTFDLTCQASGSFSKAPVCDPVLAEPVPEVNHSTYVKRNYYYGDSVVFTCVTGYTMTGKAGGLLTATMTVGTEGEWLGEVPVCLPVECGAPPTVAHASVSSTAELNFESEPVTYTCDAGYSLSASDNLWVPTKKTFRTSCQASGVVPVQTCVNINDCLLRDCGAHGTCSDSASPGEDVMKNYECTCESGYMVTIGTSALHAGAPEKVCTNINDCPEEACGGRSPSGVARGVCEDGINTYTCDCEDGYDLTTSGSNETCTPKVCAVVEAVANADLDLPSVLSDAPTYETPTWNVTCHAGYSLDGTVEGETAYSQYCTADGALTASQTCQKISCGSPPMVGHANMNPIKEELLFAEKVRYSCDTGYTLDSNASGETWFEVECTKDGNLSSSYTASPSADLLMANFMQKHAAAAARTNLERHRSGDVPQSCLPVVCGKLPEQLNATWDKTKEYVFPEVATVKCDEGYSVDQSVNLESDNYKVTCQSDGAFDSLKSCSRVVCPTPQDVEHTSRVPSEGPYVYEDRVAYEVEAGYEVDGSNESYTCTCTSSGEWDGKCAGTPTVEPHDCGTAPEVEFGTVTGSTKFGGQLVAKADTGYFVDGIADGETEFTFYCQANGLFSERKTFAPCNCGLTPEVENTAGAELTTADSSSSLLAVQHGKVHKSTRAMRRYEAVYKDVVTYTCKKGYRAVKKGHKGKVALSEETDFSLTCSASGDFVALEDDDEACAPVTCTVTAEEEDDEEEDDEEGEDLMLKAKRSNITANKARKTNKGKPVIEEGETVHVKLGEKLSYRCPEGQSTDGRRGPSSLTYTETCTETGEMTNESTCQQIDWCRWNSGYTWCRFEGKGTCVNLVDSYTCDCPEGFEAVKSGRTKVKCIAKDTCTPQGGHANCGSDLTPAMGSCVNSWPNYTCTCNEGFDKATNSLGQEICSNKYCAALPNIPRATLSKEGPEFLVGESATYTCDEGRTTTGKAGGPTQFTVSCSNKKTGSNPKAFSQRFLAASGKKVVDCSWATGKCSTIATLEEEGNYFAVDAQQPGDQPRGFLVALDGKKKAPVQYCTMSGDCHTVSTDCKKWGQGMGFNKDASGTVLGYYIICGETLKAQSVYYCPVGSSCNEIMEDNAIDTTGSSRMSVETTANGTPLALLLAGVNAAYRCPLANGGTTLEACELIGDDFVDAIYNVDYIAEANGMVSGYMVTGKSKKKVLRCPGKGQKCKTARATSYTIPGGYVAKAPNGTALGYIVTQAKKESPLYFDINNPARYSFFPDGSDLDDGMAPYSVYAPNTYTTEGVEQCLEVPCSAPAAVAHATVTGGDFYVGDVATYTCEEGYLSSLGTTNFTATCLESGLMTTPITTCEPISCGSIPEPIKAVLKEAPTTASFLYGQTLSYKCSTGYTLTGAAGGDSEFELSCPASGLLPTLPVCKAVSCGKVADVAHASTPALEFTYPETAVVSCNYGYTTTGNATGATDFSLKCQEDGSWSEGSTCSPISCGSAPSSETATTDSKEYTFQEAAAYSCKTGFSLSGTATGETSYSRICTAMGIFSESAGCTDIDHCIGDPCGSLGTCTDLPASAAPGYTCSCLEGAKVTTKDDGSEYCTQDQCHGNPCGAGSCVDLVPLGGAEGEYTCECDSGYYLYIEEMESSIDSPSFFGESLAEVKAHAFRKTTTKSAAPTCVQVPCGTLPAVEHTEHTSAGYYYEVLLSSGEAEIDKFEGQPILKSFQTARYTCATGYSPDGLYGGPVHQVTTFDITCTASGEFDRELDLEEECQPIHCETNALPSIQNSVWTKVSHESGSESEEVDFVYGEVASFKCEAGYKFSSASSVDETINSTCQATGGFTSITEKCEPIPCEITTIPHATASESSVVFGDSVTYTCESGFTGGAAATCDESGALNFPTGTTAETVCTPSGCPSSGLPTLSHGECGDSDATTESQYPVGATVPFECDSGYRFESGASSAESTCLADGTFTQLSDRCVPRVCEVPTITHGTFDTAYVSVSERVTFTCEEGYSNFFPSGTTFRALCVDSPDSVPYLQWEELWEGMAPVCEPVSEVIISESGFHFEFSALANKTQNLSRSAANSSSRNTTLPTTNSSLVARVKLNSRGQR